MLRGDLRRRQQLAGFVLAGGIADPGGAAAHQHDGLWPGALQQAQQHDRHQAADVQAVGGAVEADVADHPPAPRRARRGLRVGALVQEAARRDGAQELGAELCHGTNRIGASEPRQTACRRRVPYHNRPRPTTRGGTGRWHDRADERHLHGRHRRRPGGHRRPRRGRPRGPRCTVPYAVGFRAAPARVLGGRGAVAAVERELTLLHADAVRAPHGRGRPRAGDGRPGRLSRPHHPPRAGAGAHLADRRRGAAGASSASTWWPTSAPADVAVGGQGAPLAPLYHAALAAGLETPLAVLNLGGVGNVTWIGPGRGTVLAFDTGPGNALLDDWVEARPPVPLRPRRRARRRRPGRRAALGALLEHPYFARPAAEIAGPRRLRRQCAAAVSACEDGAATLAAFTVAAVAAAAAHLPAPPRRWLVSGGGRRNPPLMARLAERLGAAGGSGGSGRLERRHAGGPGVSPGSPGGRWRGCRSACPPPRGCRGRCRAGASWAEPGRGAGIRRVRSVPPPPRPSPARGGSRGLRAGGPACAAQAPSAATSTSTTSAASSAVIVSRVSPPIAIPSRGPAATPFTVIRPLAATR